MNYLSNVRQNLVENLWKIYTKAVPHARMISDHLQNQFIKKIPQDHFAIIDLPSKYSGMEHLKKLFELLGFCEQGRDYLPEKQNAFLWMAEIETMEKLAEEGFPQVVLADFHLSELPNTIQSIIEKYTSHISGSPLEEIEALANQSQHGGLEASRKLTELLTNYFTQRSWPLPTVKDFEAIREVNELLAWTLVFGRQPNHFTFQIHRIPYFKSLQAFNQYIVEQLNVPLNEVGGVIKGSFKMGLEQSSTIGEIVELQLSDGTSSISNCFVEFIWRYPIQENVTPIYWKDYFNDFIAVNANRVVESLYL